MAVGSKEVIGLEVEVLAILGLPLFRSRNSCPLQLFRSLYAGLGLSRLLLVSLLLRCIELWFLGIGTYCQPFIVAARSLHLSLPQTGGRLSLETRLHDLQSNNIIPKVSLHS